MTPSMETWAPTIIFRMGHLIVRVLLRQQLASVRVRSCPLMAASSRTPRACARRAPRESLRRREVLDAGYPTGRPSLPEAVSPGALRGGWIARSDPSAEATEYLPHRTQLRRALAGSGER